MAARRATGTTAATTSALPTAAVSTWPVVPAAGAGRCAAAAV
ncbi:MAG: hypothetical protein U0Y82_13275 [Thermoleophilia bacterium]